MTNIPTELLRTFVAVVDMRSFTRAAQSLGITQPAVSAQIKRLQHLLGGDLMDKSAPGVMLTPMGESVLGSARRLLAINDEILTLTATPAVDVQTIRLGIPGDFACDTLWRTIATSRASRPDVGFHLKSNPSDMLARDLHHGDLDIALVLSDADSHDGMRFRWKEPLVWVGAAGRLDPAMPVALVGHGEKCFTHRQATDALDRAGRAYRPTFTETSIASLAAAVGAGLGVMAVPRCVSRSAELAISDDPSLPPLPTVNCNICVRAGSNDMIDQFALTLADAFSAGQAAPAS